MSVALKDTFLSIILDSTAADGIIRKENIQSLWSGYGEIDRYFLHGGNHERIVVKHVKFPDETYHPRGWNTDLSHHRKLRSYQVEIAWYERWARLCDESCRIPACLALEAHEDEIFMVLEDLDAAGFPVRKTSVDLEDIHACLHWLAQFHATFLHKLPEGLWETGTYWHLETRPEELEALDDAALKSVAFKIDEKLNQCRFQTFVHGDAKLANFCFSTSGNKVASVDFQYVGGGCGMKDVAYFLGSCLSEHECERMEKPLLDYYFKTLRSAIQEHSLNVDLDDIESEWRGMFPLAWTDFHRFLKGWSPGHWKINCYSEKMAQGVISQISSDR